MHVKHEVMLLVIVLTMGNMIGVIMCKNKRIKIYVKEQIKHVHHHHVKKVPVYIVTKDKPRVMHASHIEDDFHYGTYSRTKTHPDYDNDVYIQGIYKGDESHVHEDVNDNLKYTSIPEPQVEVAYPRLPTAVSKNSNRQNHVVQHKGVRHNRGDERHKHENAGDYVEYTSTLEPQVGKTKQKLAYGLASDRQNYMVLHTGLPRNKLIMYDQ